MVYTLSQGSFEMFPAVLSFRVQHLLLTLEKKCFICGPPQQLPMPFTFESLSRDYVYSLSLSLFSSSIALMNDEESTQGMNGRKESRAAGSGVGYRNSIFEGLIKFLNGKECLLTFCKLKDELLGCCLDGWMERFYLNLFHVKIKVPREMQRTHAKNQHCLEKKK